MDYREVERERMMEECIGCEYRELVTINGLCEKCRNPEVNTYFPKNIPDQSAKADAGKPRLTKVPRQIIWDIANVREYGWQKYGEQADHWDEVEVQRYRDAAYRHFIKYLDNPQGVDEESGLTHLAHLACNIAFLCEMEKGE